MRAVLAAAAAGLSWPSPLRTAWVVTSTVAWMASACQPTSQQVDWTCDFDASEMRPLSDGDAAVGPDGALPQGVCEDTCGTPAKSCTFTVLEGGVPGAHCPVCTF
jgi:hypothetical protein